MDNFGSQNTREDVYSKAVRAGKRTYFFDVKATRNEEFYLTITESKKRIEQPSGKVFYEKHKIFLYREDFEKFRDALSEAFSAIKEAQPEPPHMFRTYRNQNEESNYGSKAAEDPAEYSNKKEDSEE
ncbi:MAG: DUF3276 family protein [Bacteroidales bacterium]|jgi:hypothetical protein|nr:DUF3276 family protein [Bacteroidales bacterium]NLM93591.1 PUR family DNA/RNA-binding protein [Bacteroidales bacterium]